MPKLTLTCLVLILHTSLYAQSPISTINLNTVTGTSNIYTATAPSDASNSIGAGTSYRVNNGTGNNEKVTSYVIAGTTYSNFVEPDTLIIQRTDGSRFVNIWYTLTQIDNSSAPTRLVLDPDIVPDADAIYQSGNINAGYDNILVNTDDQGNGTIQAQIERVDVIWYSGIVTCAPANAVFPVIERGGNDEIRLAAITSLDANGDPSAYSSTVLIEDADWPQAGVTYNNYLILRRQTLGQDPLPLINIGTLASQTAQTVQGVAVSFQELGIAAGQVVYGYSLFASDTNEANSGIDLTDITTFPTNTLASNSGIDLVAGVSAAVSSDNCLVEAVGPGGYKSSLSTWLKANDGALTTAGGSVPADGGSMAFWEDQAVGNHDFVTQGTAPSYRSTSTQMNFNPVVDFIENQERGLLTTANEDFDNITGNTGFSNKGINIVFRTNANDISTRQQIFEQGGLDSGVGIYIESGSLFVGGWQRTNQGAGSPWNNGTNANFISTGINANTEYIITLEQEGNTSSNGTIKAYLNGQQFAVFNGVGVLFNDTNGIGLGDVNGGSRYATNTTGASSLDGEIPEFIYCNEPAGFTTIQRQKTESYLAIKYGITQDQSSPVNYYNSAGNVIFNTTNNTGLGGFLTYNKDIAGIGRDDDAELIQIASKSENTGSIVKIEKINAFGQDNTFLVWGNDGGATTTQNTDVPGIISDRLTRVWRVSETGETGSLEISFDINGLGLSNDPSDFSLLVADANSSGAFSGAGTITGATLSGGILTFTAIDLEEGQFFTLGTGRLTCGPGGVSTALSFWYKANAGTSTTTDGSPVTSWADQDGNNDASGGLNTSPLYKAVGENFNPSLTFDGTDDQLTTPSGFYTDAYYAVATPANTLNRFSNAEILIGYNTASSGAADDLGGMYLGTVFGGAEIFGHTIGAVNQPLWFRIEQNANGTIDADLPQIFGSTDNIAGTDTEIYRNGLKTGTISFGTYFTLTNENFAIGSFASNSGNFTSYFEGDFSEAFSFSSRPTDVQLGRVNSYLAVKYGITLDQSVATDYNASDGTAIWTASAFTGFNNDIAGVLRDDLSCLEQKQSKSQNADAIVTMGLGTIETDNLSNTNSFTADISSLMWSSDAAAKEQANANTVDVPATVTERMTRIWKVQETGTVGDMSVSFDLTGLGYSTTAEDFQLIISGAATMATGVTYGGGVINGNVITFSNVDFADGDYFTLGTQSTGCGPGGVTAGLALWLRADEGTNTTTDGATVSAWADQSTVGRDASSVGLGGASLVNPTYEVNEINFNPGIRIYDVSSSNNVFLRTTGGNDVADNMSIFSVYKSGSTDGTANSMTGSPAIVGADTGGDEDYGLGLQGGRPYFNAASTNTFTAQSTSQYVSNVPHILGATRALSGSANIYVDSNLDGTGTSDASSLTGSFAFGIGNHNIPNTGAQFDGVIGEAIVFSSVLSSEDRNKVESYLAVKYGITRNGIDDSGTLTVDERDYRSANGTVTWDYDGQTPLYYNDIAGIGNDSESCFTQLKSKSNNSDAIVTMGVNSLNSDNSFLLWGNDNASLEDPDNREYNDAQVQSRLNREWRVQETGTMGTVQLEFDLTGVTGPTGPNTNNLNQLRLMVDADGDFNSGVTLVSPSQVSGNIVTFDVDFNGTDGYFFTLGSEEEAALPVVLTSFSADILENQFVMLSWATASEQDNDYFVVQRSSDGSEFEDLDYVQGGGDSQSTLSYSYLDTESLTGISYYRLIQVDFNGLTHPSPVIRVKTVRNEALMVYPNPVNAGNDVLLRVPDGDEVLAITILDSRGETVVRYKMTERSDGRLKLKSDTLRRGVYLLIVKTKRGTQTLRLIVN